MPLSIAEGKMAPSSNDDSRENKQPAQHRQGALCGDFFIRVLGCLSSSSIKAKRNPNPRVKTT
jgi:hypothetical protein